MAASRMGLGARRAGDLVLVHVQQPPVLDDLFAVHERRRDRGRRAEDEGGDRVGDRRVGQGVQVPEDQVGELARLQ